MHSVCEPNGRANKKWRAAETAQPYGGHFRRMIEKKDTATGKPQGNKEIINDAGSLVLTSHRQRSLAQLEMERFGLVLLILRRHATFYKTPRTT